MTKRHLPNIISQTEEKRISLASSQRQPAMFPGRYTLYNNRSMAKVSFVSGAGTRPRLRRRGRGALLSQRSARGEGEQQGNGGEVPSSPEAALFRKLDFLSRRQARNSAMNKIMGVTEEIGLFPPRPAGGQAQAAPPGPVPQCPGVRPRSPQGRGRRALPPFGAIPDFHIG